MEEFQKLILQSIQLYREIESIYHDIDQTSGDASFLEVNENNSKLDLLFQNVKQVDISLTQLIDSTETVSNEISTLLAQRKQILERARNQNKSLYDKISNITSLIQHEIGTVSNGRSAIKGYNSQSKGRKGIISNSF